MTGARRLHYAKKHELRELPCIIWEDNTELDITLAQLIEIAHKHEYTDEEKGTAIAAAYLANLISNYN